jgi:hypothetical protein
MSSEDKDSFKSDLEWVLENGLHNFIASGIKLGPVVVDHRLEVSDSLLKLGEDTLDVSLKIFEFLVFNMHYLEVSKNFKELLIDVVDQGVHEKDGSVVWVRISS